MIKTRSFSMAISQTYIHIPIHEEMLLYFKSGRSEEIVEICSVAEMLLNGNYFRTVYVFDTILMRLVSSITNYATTLFSIDYWVSKLLGGSIWEWLPLEASPLIEELFKSSEVGKEWKKGP